MHRSTCTNELELKQNKRLDLNSDDDLQNETENEDPASIGTPVCLPAVVWFENCDGILVVNVQWRGRAYVGALFDSSRQKNINQNRLLAKTEERNPENGNNKKKRKYKEAEKFLREITLEENIEAADMSQGEKREKLTNEGKIRMYKCSECDRKYKFASGLQHHIKHSHGEDDIS